MDKKHSGPGMLVRSIPRKWRVIALSVLALAIILAGVLTVLSRQQATHASSAGDWPSYMGDDKRSGFNEVETMINATSAPNLKLHWKYQAGGGIFAQAVVSDGVIYWGSLDGYEHATKLDGTQIWQQNVGRRTTCSPLPSLGVVSTAEVASVSLGGKQTSVVFVGGGDGNFYALRATTGAVIWRTPIGNPPSNTFIWSSPLVYNNSVYIGTATTGEPHCPLVPGQFFQLDVATGSIQHIFNTVPDGCLGAGVWSSATLDISDGSIYFTTGTEGSFKTCKEPLAIAIVKLHASDLSLISSWQIPITERGPDSDFGASATLFNATIGGTVHKLVGAVDKNGYYYALDRAGTAMSNGPVWKAKIAEGGECPQCGQGSISSSAWNGKTLFVAGGKTTIKGMTCKGSLRALYPATGAFIWERCFADGPVMGSVTMVPGVAAVVAGPNLILVSSVTGKTLYTSQGSGIAFYGSPSISHGVLYVGSTTKHLYAYGT